MKNNKKVENKSEVVSVTNKSNTSRIVSIVLIVLFTIITLAIVVSSFLPKTYNLGFKDPALIRIHLADHDDTVNGTVYGKNIEGRAEQYDKLMSLYNDSFKTTVLSAVFQGKAFTGIKVEEGYKSLSESSLKGSDYIEFLYDESQTLVVNGKEYQANIVSDTNYISVMIELNNSTSLSKINAYFKYRATGENDYSYVRLETYATQNALYDYIQSL